MEKISYNTLKNNTTLDDFNAKEEKEEIKK